MNKYDLVGLNALLILVIALPIYGLREADRMIRTQAKLRQQYVMTGATMYVGNCAYCHGVAGEGVGSMPALNNPGLAEADAAVIYRTIAHSPHGSTMAAWHIDQGGILNDYQVEGLVNLIQHGNWSQVSEMASAREFDPPQPSVPNIESASLAMTDQAEPHECRACHEQPPIHADRFGLDCARCHTLSAWKPALLSQHIFRLDHGGQGRVACETCHTNSYTEYTCYQCHDHNPAQTVAVHPTKDLGELDKCVECHPTGQPDEAQPFVKSQPVGRDQEQIATHSID